MAWTDEKHLFWWGEHGAESGDLLSPLPHLAAVFRPHISDGSLARGRSTGCEHHPLGRGTLQSMCPVPVPSNHPSLCPCPSVVAEEQRPPSNGEAGAACPHLQLHPSLLPRKSGITLSTQHRHTPPPAPRHLLHPHLWMSNLLLCHPSHLHHECPAPGNAMLHGPGDPYPGPCLASEPLWGGRAPLPLLLRPPASTRDIGGGDSPWDMHIA